MVAAAAAAWVLSTRPHHAEWIDAQVLDPKVARTDDAWGSTAASELYLLHVSVSGGNRELVSAYKLAPQGATRRVVWARVGSKSVKVTSPDTVQQWAKWRFGPQLDGMVNSHKQASG